MADTQCWCLDATIKSAQKHEKKARALWDTKKANDYKAIRLWSEVNSFQIEKNEKNKSMALIEKLILSGTHALY